MKLASKEVVWKHRSPFHRSEHVIPFYFGLRNTNTIAVNRGNKICGDLCVLFVPASAAAVVIDAGDVPSHGILGNEVYKSEPTSKKGTLN